MNSITGLPGGNSEWEPPDSIPNSEVKLLSADGSVGLPHVRVGHRQAFMIDALISNGQGVFIDPGFDPLAWASAGLP